MFRKIFYLILFVLVLSLAGSASGASVYTWTGAAGDGLWSSADNWMPAGPPPHDSGAVYVAFSDQTRGSLITIPAGFAADCTFGNTFGTIFGPEFIGLSIYGSLTYQWYLAPVQTYPTGPRSFVNMYEGSSITGEGIAIGDNWWFPAPYVTMNMYGNSSANINWLWVGGHLNMYGGTMDIKQGVEMSKNVDDAMTRVNIYTGRLILPADVNNVVIQDWISRGILLAYGQAPGVNGSKIIIDVNTTPGRTIVTATASGAMTNGYYNGNGDSELWAKVGLAVSSIEQNKDSEAGAITDRLTTDFKSNPKLPQALFHIAGRYVSSQKYDKAAEIYNTIIRNYPKNGWVRDSEFELARINVLVYLDKNNEPNTLSAIDKLTSEFNDRPDLTAAVFDIGAGSDWQNQYEPNDLTKKIYDKVIEQFSASPQARTSKLNISRMNVISLINSGDDAGALAGTSALITDFNSCPDLSMAVSLIADKYYAIGLLMQNEGLKTRAEENYQKSIIVREMVIQKLPSSELTPQAYYLSAVLYSDYLHQYQKGIEYFQKVVDNWPDYQFAWNAQFFIGFYYEKLRNSGAITASQANPKIEQAYRGVVEKYPDSEPAPYIALKLARQNFEKGQWKQAIRYFEFYLGKFPDQFASVVLPLGQCYEKMGEPETAIDLYRTFLDLAGPSDPQIKTVKAGLEILEEQSK